MDKIKNAFQSRKFWTFVSAIVAIVGGVAAGAITPAHGIDLFVLAAGAYTVGTGLENVGNNAVIQDALKKALMGYLVTMPLDEPDHK